MLTYTSSLNGKGCLRETIRITTTRSVYMYKERGKNRAETMNLPFLSTHSLVISVVKKKTFNHV